jgi:glutamyl-tRNA reductase
MSVDSKKQGRRARSGEDVLPLCLLAKGQTGLIVGGGKVAVRKARGLLDAGIKVRVVSPRLSPELAEMAERKLVEWQNREFVDADVQGVLVAYAATNDRSVNSRVLRACREAGTLCSRVDREWLDGDFVSPATGRQNGVTVSVSSGGRSCRRSRALRDALASHLEELDRADLFVAGISNRQLGIENLESWRFSEREEGECASMLQGVVGVNEFTLLKTCNRTEIWGVGSDSRATTSLISKSMGFDGLDPGQYYIRRGMDAFSHSVFVTAGLLSQSPGESHVVSQVKESLTRGLSSGWSGRAMKQWISECLKVSRAVRGVAAGMIDCGEIEDTCIDFLDTTEAWPKDDAVLLMGSGTVGRNMAGRLAARKQKTYWCYHSLRPRKEFDNDGCVTLVPFRSLAEMLKGASVIISALSVEKPVLTPAHAGFLSGRGPVTVVDAGIPRNIDPRIADVLPDVRIMNLDDLKHWHRRHSVDLESVFEKAGRIVNGHKELYEELVGSFRD